MANANTNAFSVGQLANIGGQLYVMMPANNAAELLQVQTLAAAAAQSSQPALVLANANALDNGDGEGDMEGGGDASLDNEHDAMDRESDALSSSSSVVAPASPGSSAAVAAAANNHHLSSASAAGAGSANSSLNLGAPMALQTGVGGSADQKATPIIRDERRRATHNEGSYAYASALPLPCPALPYRSVASPSANVRSPLLSSPLLSSLHFSSLLAAANICLFSLACLS